MFKSIYKSEKCKQLLVKRLEELYSEYNWNIRLGQIYSKYYDTTDDEQFDTTFLYMLTYGLRGHIKEVPNQILKNVCMSLFTTHVSKVVIQMFKPSRLMELSIKYGTYVVSTICEYYKQFIYMLEFLHIPYVIDDNETEFKMNPIEAKNSLYIMLCNVIEPSKTVTKYHWKRVISPMLYTNAKNDDEILVNTVLLNLLNCCFGDTITDAEHPYIAIKFNIFC